MNLRITNRASVRERQAFASKGGKARAKALTKEQRSEAARKAVNTRWAKRKATQQ